MNTEMVVFGEDWGRHPSSTQHLMQQLRAEWPLIWVNSIGLRWPRLNGYDMQRMWQKCCAMLSTKPALSHTVRPSFVMDAHALPPCRNPWLSRYNGRLIANSIFQHYPVKQPLMWSSLPSAVDAIDALSPRATVYYCGDDFAHLSGVDHEVVQYKERQLAQRADLIICASDTLADKFPHHKTKVLPHGVDLPLFQTPQPRPTDLPDSPLIAGFYGALDQWFDQALLREVALACPEWQFVLIGPQKVTITDLLALPNVHWLGVKPHAALAAYVQHWQVSLLPFLLTPQIHACNPLKLREYLAVGTPILSTDFPALQPYRDVLLIDNQASGWISTLQSLPHQPDQQQQQRRERVQTESWKSRSAEVQQWLQQLV